MQNYWNLDLYCKRRQLTLPVNYRNFRETGPRFLEISGDEIQQLAGKSVNIKYNQNYEDLDQGLEEVGDNHGILTTI